MCLRREQGSFSEGGDAVAPPPRRRARSIARRRAEHGEGVTAGRRFAVAKLADFAGAHFGTGAHSELAPGLPATMCDLSATSEARALAYDDARPVLFMATTKGVGSLYPTSDPATFIYWTFIGFTLPAYDSATRARVSR